MGKRVKILVYGTLRKDGRLHYAIKEDPTAKLVCEDKVSGRIYSNMESYPCLDITKEGTVVGEVYDIDERLMLGRLDQIEGYRPGYDEGCLFLRKFITTHGGHEVFIYTMGPMMQERFKDRPHIESGDWIKYAADLEAKWKAEHEANRKKTGKGKKKK